MMNSKSKEIILKDMVRRLQTALELALENGEILSEVKSWIEKTVDAVNQDLTKMDSVTKEKKAG